MSFGVDLFVKYNIIKLIIILVLFVIYPLSFRCLIILTGKGSVQYGQFLMGMDRVWVM